MKEKNLLIFKDIELLEKYNYVYYHDLTKTKSDAYETKVINRKKPLSDQFVMTSLYNKIIVKQTLNGTINELRIIDKSMDSKDNTDLLIINDKIKRFRNKRKDGIVLKDDENNNGNAIMNIMQINMTNDYLEGRKFTASNILLIIEKYIKANMVNIKIVEGLDI